jgi:hypothetical protein
LGQRVGAPVHAAAHRQRRIEPDDVRGLRLHRAGLRVDDLVVDPAAARLGGGPRIAQEPFAVDARLLVHATALHLGLRAVDPVAPPAVDHEHVQVPVDEARLGRVQRLRRAGHPLRTDQLERAAEQRRRRVVAGHRVEVAGTARDLLQTLDLARARRSQLPRVLGGGPHVARQRVVHVADMVDPRDRALELLRGLADQVPGLARRLRALRQRRAVLGQRMSRHADLHRAAADLGDHRRRTVAHPVDEAADLGHLVAPVDLDRVREVVAGDRVDAAVQPLQRAGEARPERPAEPRDARPPTVASVI